MWKELEGYLVVVGRAEPFLTFFKAFDGRPPIGPSAWGAEMLGSLERSVREEAFYFEERGDADARVLLDLDHSAIEDLTEGWIPVRAGAEFGVLVFANSD